MSDGKNNSLAGHSSTEQTRYRYNRIAPVYDNMEAMLEHLAFGRWRKKLWSRIINGDGLEVGVGTCKNIPYYPSCARVTAIDLSPEMLERARVRAKALDSQVNLIEMDAQDLKFPDATFDWVVATFVLCSVPDPVQGLRELARVLRPSGYAFLLEHVRTNTPLLGRLMDIFNRCALRVMGTNITRRTVANVTAAGLLVEKVEDLAPFGLVKLITAVPSKTRSS